MNNNVLLNQKIQAAKAFRNLQLFVFIFAVFSSFFTNHEDTKTFLESLLCLKPFLVWWSVIHIVILVVGVFFIFYENRIKMLMDNNDEDSAGPRILIKKEIGNKKVPYQSVGEHGGPVYLGNMEKKMEDQNIESREDLSKIYRDHPPSIDLFSFPKYWLNDRRFYSGEVIRAYIPDLNRSIEYRFSPDRKKVYRRISEEDGFHYPEKFKEFDIDTLHKELKLLGSEMA